MQAHADAVHPGMALRIMQFGPYLSLIHDLQVLKNNIEVWRCSDMYATAEFLTSAPWALIDNLIFRYGASSYILSAPEIDCGTSCEFMLD